MAFNIQALGVLVPHSSIDRLHRNLAVLLTLTFQGRSSEVLFERVEAKLDGVEPVFLRKPEVGCQIRVFLGCPFIETQFHQSAPFGPHCQLKANDIES